MCNKVVSLGLAALEAQITPSSLVRGTLITVQNNTIMQAERTKRILRTKHAETVMFAILPFDIKMQLS